MYIEFIAQISIFRKFRDLHQGFEFLVICVPFLLKIAHGDSGDETAFSHSVMIQRSRDGDSGVGRQKVLVSCREIFIDPVFREKGICTDIPGDKLVPCIAVKRSEGNGAKSIDPGIDLIPDVVCCLGAVKVFFDKGAYTYIRIIALQSVQHLFIHSRFDPVI